MRLRVCLLTLLLWFAGAGCVVQSKYQTRSYLTPEQFQEVMNLYKPPEASGRKLDPFLEGVDGVVFKVNAMPVFAKDVRALYNYLGSVRKSESYILKREAVFELMRIYATMTQWPQQIRPARERIRSLYEKARSGVDFRGLIVENSMEPDVQRTGGDLGWVNANDLEPVFAMHAVTDPLNRVSEPFATVYGWHIIEPLERDTSDPLNPRVHVRHLLLVHGLDPANLDIIRADNGANTVRWRNTSTVVMLNSELQRLFPRFPTTEPETWPNMPEDITSLVE